MLEIKEVTLSRGSKTLLEDASILIGTGEKVGLVGVNGAGKTTLLRALRGDLAPDAGKIVCPARVGYLGQERLSESLLVGSDASVPVTVRTALLAGRDLAAIGAELRAIEAELEWATAPHAGKDAGATGDVLLARYGALEERFALAGGYSAEHEMAELLVGLGLGEVEMERPVAALSGGQKTRLALARLMLGGYNTLLLDEPTNNLDPISRDRVREALAHYRGTLIIVSHDTEFVKALQPDLGLQLPEGKVRYFDQGQLALVAKM